MVYTWRGLHIPCWSKIQHAQSVDKFWYCSWLLLSWTPWLLQVCIISCISWICSKTTIVHAATTWNLIKWFVLNSTGRHFLVNGFVWRESKGTLTTTRFGLIKSAIMNKTTVKYWLFGSYENCIHAVCYIGGYLARFDLLTCNKIISSCLIWNLASEIVRDHASWFN